MKNMSKEQFVSSKDEIKSCRQTLQEHRPKGLIRYRGGWRIKMWGTFISDT
jgi:hypothetical protein